MSAKSPVSILKRLVEILHIVSQSTGRRVGTQEILQKLQEKNIHVSQRTIQRDLRMMQEVGFPIDVDMEKAEADWWIQELRGECAKKMGYDGCEDEDEQGSVYIVPMFGREEILVLEGDDWNE